VTDAVSSAFDIETIVVAHELLNSQFALGLVDDVRVRGVPILEVTTEVFNALSFKEGPQGLGAVVRQRWERLPAAYPENAHYWIALEGVQDPGNLGAILRTADAVGAGGVILLGQSTDPYDPSALRASMGAIFWQAVIRSSPAELERWRRQHNVYLVGTSDKADTDYTRAQYRLPLILLMGSERLGLSRAQQELCDVVVRIPMVGKSDSLNLAVATSLMLYEIFNRQRRAGT
jgi:TrmH family RNA methyltransferase